MTVNREDESDTEWRDRFRQMSQFPEPPAWLEQRVIDSLGSRGLFAPAGRKHLGGAWAWAALTACVLCFAAGIYWERRQTAIPFEAESSRYVLLLIDASGGAAPGSAQDASLTEEYSAWAQRERKAGHVLGGEKLKPAVLALSGPEGGQEIRTEDRSLGGYFVIRAPDLAAAVEIARSCPHLKYGGTILLRPVDATPRH